MRIRLPINSSMRYPKSAIVLCFDSVQLMFLVKEETRSYRRRAGRTAKNCNYYFRNFMMEDFPRMRTSESTFKRFRIVEVGAPR